jgi:hypothetical protein
MRMKPAGNAKALSNIKARLKQMERRLRPIRVNKFAIELAIKTSEEIELET